MTINNPSPGEPLVPNQIRILELMAEGLSNKEIGAKMYLAENTIKTYCRSMYVKLGVVDRTQAVIEALRTGQIKLPGIHANSECGGHGDDVKMSMEFAPIDLSVYAQRISEMELDNTWNGAV